MKIRNISLTEMPQAISLIWETFLQFEAPDYSQEGIQSFRAFLSDEKIHSSLEFFGAFEQENLLGVIATMDHQKHICCFFVNASHQGQGIGKALWEYVKNHSCHSAITVNSSPFAVPIYHKLGFVDISAEQLSDGIRYTPMIYYKSS